MILIILILAVIAFIYFNVIPRKGHTPAALVSLLITFACIVGIVAHDYNHLGMKVKNSTITKELVSSASPKLPVLLYQPLGQGKEKIYLYKTNAAAPKPTPIKTENSSARVQRAPKPTLTISTQRYVFKNGLDNFLFGWFGHENELKHREYTFKIPQTWKVLSVKQARLLQKQMLSKQK